MTPMARERRRARQMLEKDLRLRGKLHPKQRARDIVAAAHKAAKSLAVDTPAPVT